MSRQDRREKRAPIVVESLEGRVVLSTMTTILAVHPTTHVTPMTTLNLQGSAHGTVSTVVGGPVVGTTIMLHGSGQVQPLGLVNLSGLIHGTGLAASSHVQGTVKLTSGRGSTTLQVQSPTAGGFAAPRSGTYSFHASTTSGALAHESGNGTASLLVQPHTFSVSFANPRYLA